MIPPHISKHQCYARWCWERGWKVEKKNLEKTIYESTQNYSIQQHYDEDESPLWPTGSEFKRVASWPAFLLY
eukprot:8528524-Ditylum_brightwellii.AAC.1